ncbi:MAG: decaprenyl-phosphate phosphoribosyltransferase [Chloroflexi bacterium]|nr:decaprenyl-phosphate phosphoribosyltransferase [Chloroflexota bacterium]
MLFNLLKSMRPRQWVKNLLVFVPFAFTLRQYWQPFSPQMYALFALAAVAFLVFCLLAGVVYLINDLADVEKDRNHPTKRFRPLASGALNKRQAVGTIVVLLFVAIPLSFILDLTFGLVAVFYLALNLLYSFALKNIVIVDVFTLAANYVLRVLAGAVAIHVPPSAWLFVCTMLMSLFVGFAKRRHELVLLEDNATTHRQILKEYTAEVLDEMIAVTTASFVMAYSLYTFTAENLPKNHEMMLTIPFALYTVFRLLYLVHVKQEGGSPEELVLRDKPLFVAIMLWGLAVVLIFYFFGRTPPV